MSDTSISKFLALVLRHQPEKIKIKIDEHGWTDLDILADRLGENIGSIRRIVENDNKKRYTVDMEGRRIKANQGHSIKGVIAFDTTPKEPPQTLYHGTTEERWEKIKTSGLSKRQRHHVHLSITVDTAMIVAKRHKRETALLLIIDASSMYRDRCNFYLTDNDIWLTDLVLPEYITTDHLWGTF